VLTVTAEASPYCGQSGRVCRVFWRAGAPWVLLRTSSGLRVPVPWHATDLPVPPVHGPAPATQEAVLLAPAALVALLRFLQQQTAVRVDRHDVEASHDDAGRARRDGGVPGAREQVGRSLPR
jgi:hypothetical protein